MFENDNSIDARAMTCERTSYTAGACDVTARFVMSIDESDDARYHNERQTITRMILTLPHVAPLSVDTRTFTEMTPAVPVM